VDVPDQDVLECDGIAHVSDRLAELFSYIYEYTDEIV